MSQSLNLKITISLDFHEPVTCAAQSPWKPAGFNLNDTDQKSEKQRVTEKGGGQFMNAIEFPAPVAEPEKVRTKTRKYVFLVFGFKERFSFIPDQIKHV